jgi:CHAT domain-containing protein
VLTRLKIEVILTLFSLAFKVAGAKTIVMSMWKVDDEVTQKLMSLFYQKYAQKQQRPQSLQRSTSGN